MLGEHSAREDWYAEAEDRELEEAAESWDRIEAARRSGSAQEAYDRFAPVYNDFNAQNNYEHWLGEVLLPELLRLGLNAPVGDGAHRVLDVGCGTGRAFAPLLQRGWEVWGCDLSERMLLQAEVARRESPWSEHVGALFVADARDLPNLRQPFDLIIALNDVINYLTEDGDLELFFEGVKRNLAPGGLVCFDANTLSLYRANFASGLAEAMGSGEHDEWIGRSESVEPGGLFEAEVSAPGAETHTHRQRHWTQGQVKNALAEADLEPVAILGQLEADGRVSLSNPPNEDRDQKIVYIGRAAEE